MSRIDPATVLPAGRTAVTLHTADGLRLVGELARPVRRPPRLTLVCVPPAAVDGGSMDHPLLTALGRRLPALADLAVLRVNPRGAVCAAGTSEGTAPAPGDPDRGARFDLAAALDLVEAEELPAPWLVGVGSGAEPVLRWGLDPEVAGAVLVAPAWAGLEQAVLDAWLGDGRPLTAVVGDDVPTGLSALPAAQRSVLDAVDPSVDPLTLDACLDVMVRAVLPGASPLPREWPPSV